MFSCLVERYKMTSIAHKHWSSITAARRSHPDAVSFAFSTPLAMSARSLASHTLLSGSTRTVCQTSSSPSTDNRPAYYMCISDMATAPGTESLSIQSVCCSWPARRSRHQHVSIRPLHAASLTELPSGSGWPSRTTIPCILPGG